LNHGFEDHSSTTLVEVNTPIEAPTVSLDVAVDVNQLFATPVWSAHLGFMDRHVDAMLRDITGLVRGSRTGPWLSRR
jgi:hypothetical protein